MFEKEKVVCISQVIITFLFNVHIIGVAINRQEKRRRRKITGCKILTGFLSTYVDERSDYGYTLQHNLSIVLKMRSIPKKQSQYFVYSEHCDKLIGMNRERNFAVNEEKKTKTKRNENEMENIQ